MLSIRKIPLTNSTGINNVINNSLNGNLNSLFVLKSIRDEIVTKQIKITSDQGTLEFMVKGFVFIELLTSSKAEIINRKEMTALSTILTDWSDETFLIENEHRFKFIEGNQIDKIKYLPGTMRDGRGLFKIQTEWFNLLIQLQEVTSDSEILINVYETDGIQTQNIKVYKDC